MIDYIFKVLLFQALFLLIYDLLLKRETFFQWNRVYLLVTPLVAYLIPFIEMNLVSNSVPEEYMLVLPEVILSPETVIEEQVSWYTSGYDILSWILWLGGIIAAILFFIKLYKVIRLILSNEQIKRDSYYLIFTTELSAFSFFKYIFLHKGLAEKDKQQVIDHELVHIRQWHSLDLLLFEVQRIVFWFNPFSYIYQDRIAMLHEYIADSKSIKPATKQAYFQVLLNTAFGTKNISFINPFFEKTSIKKRINMFNRARSKEIFRIKYIIALPMLFAMFTYSSCENDSRSKVLFPKNEKKAITLYYEETNSDTYRQIKSEREGYFDVYIIQTGQPPGVEISYEDLTEEEKQEFDVLSIQKFIKREGSIIKIFVEKDGRKSIMVSFDFKDNNISSKIKSFGNSDSIPFAAIDQVPIFPDCEGQVDPKKCTISFISLHVHKNFNSAISKDLDLEPGTKRVYVQFTIDKTGSITDVRARAPHEQLEEEAIRVVKTLPQMIPGEQKGKKVAVKYTLPITIKIE